jgi:hypothetical protein
LKLRLTRSGSKILLLFGLGGSWNSKYAPSMAQHTINVDDQLKATRRVLNRYHAKPVTSSRVLGFHFYQ